MNISQRWHWIPEKSSDPFAYRQAIRGKDSNKICKPEQRHYLLRKDEISTIFLRLLASEEVVNFNLTILQRISTDSVQETLK
jgi:hypothetical protein